jgi:DNA replicative helicase MCM subunit Mcm2 (Cdc46/Mcm family)
MKDKKHNEVFTEKPEINELDLEMISTNISNPKYDYKNTIYRIILNLCSKSIDNKAKKEDIIIKAKKLNIDLMRVEDSIERLKRSEKILEKNGFIFIS